MVKENLNCEQSILLEPSSFFKGEVDRGGDDLRAILEAEQKTLSLDEGVGVVAEPATELPFPPAGHLVGVERITPR